MKLAAWRKSTYSDDPVNNCVEVAMGPVVGVRDTKDRAGGQLALTRTAWDAFLTTVGQEVRT